MRAGYRDGRGSQGRDLEIAQKIIERLGARRAELVINGDRIP